MGQTKFCALNLKNRGRHCMWDGGVTHLTGHQPGECKCKSSAVCRRHLMWCFNRENESILFHSTAKWIERLRCHLFLSACRYFGTESTRLSSERDYIDPFIDQLTVAPWEGECD